MFFRFPGWCRFFSAYQPKRPRPSFFDVNSGAPRWSLYLGSTTTDCLSDHRSRPAHGMFFRSTEDVVGGNLGLNHKSCFFVENGCILFWKGSTIGDTPIFHWTMFMGGRVCGFSKIYLMVHDIMLLSIFHDAVTGILMRGIHVTQCYVCMAASMYAHTYRRLVNWVAVRPLVRLVRVSSSWQDAEAEGKAQLGSRRHCSCVCSHQLTGAHDVHVTETFQNG